MATIRLSAVVGKDGYLTIKVPDDVPAGVVEVVIHVPDKASPSASNRAAVRAKLAAAGLLGLSHLPPSNLVIPTDLEVKLAGSLPPNARPSEELIDEDRNEA